MWPWGHLAVGYLVYRGWRGEAHLGVAPLFALAVGTQFPDLVDKPLAWGLGVLPAGRTLAHSLLFVVPLVVCCLAVSRYFGRTEVGLAFGVGIGTHILADVLPALWDPGTPPQMLLWPILALPESEHGVPGITALFLDALGDPYFLVQFGFLALALGLWHRDEYPPLPALWGLLRD